jgi:hypothetical protein
LRAATNNNAALTRSAGAARYGLVAHVDALNYVKRSLNYVKRSLNYVKRSLNYVKRV